MKIIALFLVLSSLSISYAQAGARGNPDHFKKFAQTGECTQCDLRDFNLAAAIHIFQSNLTYSKKAIDLEGSNISGASLKKVKLWDANMTGVIAEGTDFSEACLENPDFTGANLKKAIFIGTSVKGASFQKANLQETNALGIFLMESNFTEADLSTINLSQADIFNVNFQSAKLDNANLMMASLKWCKFKSASLKSALLKRADLDHADFDSADVENADFQQVKNWKDVQNKGRMKNFSRAKNIPKD